MKMYYEDGTVYEGDPLGSPYWGLVAISQPGSHPAFRNALVDGPFFLHRSDWRCWMECDYAGILDQLTHNAHVIDCVRVGRYIRDDQFKAIWRAAIEDGNG